MKRLKHRNEGDLSREIQNFIRHALGGKVIKTSGIVTGTPDLIGALNYLGHKISFAIEVKMPGEWPSPAQNYELAQWSKYGWMTGTVHNVDDFVFILETFIDENSTLVSSE